MIRKRNHRQLLIALLIAFSMVAVSMVRADVTLADDGSTPDNPPADETTQESMEGFTETPTEIPTETLTETPLDLPTEGPINEPTEEPTEESTEESTEEPQEDPTAAPTDDLTDIPTQAPTTEPTDAAAEESTATPTEEPTLTPTATETPALMAALKTPDGEVIPHEYIVVYKDTVKANRKQSAIKAFVEGKGGKLKFMYNKALNGYSAYLTDEALQAVLADPDVAYVEANMVVDINDGQNMAAQDTQSGATWGLDRIDQRDLPLNGQYTYDSIADGVHVYILDTGIRSTHSDFGGRASADFDSINDGQAGNDCNGHGTHVAGTIGGSTYGVAKGVYLHGVRVLNCNGAGSTDTVVDGIDWIISNHQTPAVANMSLGGSVNSSLDTAINNLINAGITTVVAAGNNGDDACSYSPSRVPNAITVGNTTASDVRSSSSNYGTCLDIFAPGSSITSDYYTSDTATATMNGTSMASPHVAGAAALYLQSNPSASPATVTAFITGNATSGLITNTGSGSPNLLLYSRYNAIPTPSSPAGTITDTTPVYQWAEVFGATYYQLQVYQNSSLVIDTVISTGSHCSSGTCQALPATELGAGTYDWRMRAYVNGSWKSYSDYLSFEVFISTIPSLVSPSGTITETNPVYQWTEVEGATYYQLQVYQGSTLVVNTVMTTGSRCSAGICKALPGVELEGSAYNWQVRAYAGGAWHGYSGSTSFTVNIITVSTAISPEGTITSTRPTYSWSKVPGATYYQLQIYRSSDLLDSRVMNSGICSGSTCSTSPITNLTSGWYSWRVRAYINGSWADYSSSTDYRVYIAPTPVSPAGTISITRPTYSWSAVSGATYYQLQIYNTSGLIDSRVMNSSVCSGSACSTSPNVILNSGWYNWRVRAYINGGWADYSSNTVFRVYIAPTAISPYSTSSNNSPTYTWSIVSGATYYQLQVYDPIGLVNSKVVSSGICSSYTCRTAFSTPLMDGWHKWRVRAYLNGAWADYSGYKNFRVYGSVGSSFNTQFNTSGNFEGWEAHTGASWNVDSGLLYTPGLTNYYTSSSSYSRQTNFTDFTYEARLRMEGPAVDEYNAHGLIIRGTPNLDSKNDWMTGYYFGLLQVNSTNNGLLTCYNVYQIEDGTWSSLTQGGYWWCYSAFNYTGWNVFRVQADANSMVFYINDLQMLSTTVSGATSGRLGVFSYGPSGAAYVDWAKAAPLATTSTTSASGYIKPDSYIDLEPQDLFKGAE